ncbi:MAG TPA: hypothetical protein VJ692_06075 [Nitrospiraceae bacterium]|nr:hypothetical protein [Nitrospiraceae bacterium]
MNSKQEPNKKQHGASPKDRRVGHSIEEPSGDEARGVPEASINPDPIRVLGGSMRMGVDLGNEISGNPNAVPNANAGGPSSPQNIVGDNPEPATEPDGEKKQTTD